MTSPGCGAQPHSSGGGAYTVRPGDSLYGIAHRHGVTIGSLLAANRLKPDQRHPPRPAIDDPWYSGAQPHASSGGAYTVRPGDSLYGIAHRHGVTIGAC